MNRRTRTGLGVLAAALVGLAALGATGMMPIPWLGPVSKRAPETERPDELSVPDGGPGHELAVSGGRTKTAKPGEVATEVPDEPALPSEASGTAIGKVGGSIRGRVVESEAKRPVAGATVELLMPEALFHYLRASSVGRFDRLSVMTDREGRFALNSVLPADDYELRVRKGAGPYATRPIETLAAREVLDVGDIVMGPTGGLSGHVVGSDGKGIADARIAITWKIENDFDAVMADPDTLPWTETSVKTDADGAWKAEGLEPGNKTLVVQAPSGAADVKASVAVVAGITTPGVDWTLGGAFVIAGRVEWADGKPIESARVFAKTMKMPASFTVESGADGSFRLTGLSEGVYFVGAFIPGMSVQLIPGKKTGDENVRIVVPLSGTLTGRVVSKSTGAPITQFKLTPVFSDAQDWMQNFVGKKIDKVLGGAGFQSSEGTFRFDRLKSGHYTLHVEAEGYPPTESAPVEVIAGAEAKSGDILLPDGNRISGVVRDAAGAPIADATIVILNFDSYNFGDQSLADEEKVLWVWNMPEETRTDEKGAFTTTPLTPRTYDLGVRIKGYLSRVGSFDVSTKSVDRAEFRLDRAGAAVLHARSASGRPVSGTEVALCDAAGFVKYGQSDPHGEIDLSELRPGRWTALEPRRDFFASYWHQRKSASFDGPAFFEGFRTSPGSVEFTVAAGERVERTITVTSLAQIEGRVRFGGRKPAQSWFALRSSGDSVNQTWVSFNEDGSFVEDKVKVGHYVVMSPPELAAKDAQFTEAGTLDVPEGGLKGIEIDLSK